MNKNPAFGTSFSRFFDVNIPGLVYFDNYNYIPTDLYYFEIPLEVIKNSSIKWKNNVGCFLKTYIVSNRNISDKQPKVKKNLHYEEKNKEKLFYNLILDMFFILKSDYFVPSINSGVSKILIQMIEKNIYFFRI